MKKITTLLLLMIMHQCIMSQSVGIGTASPNASAQLDVSSNNKGLLTPRMTLTQRNAIASPANGLIIYQTDNTPGFYFYNGSSWLQLSTGSSTNYWNSTGSHIYSNNTGNVGIGVNPPAYKLDLGGRMRIRTGTLNNVSTSSGIWMEDFRTGTNRIFFGMQDSIHAGFYGGGAGDIGWDFNFNAKNGNIGIGVDNPTDKLHVKGPARFDATGSSLAIIKMYAAQTNDFSFITFYNQLSATSPSAYVAYDGGNDRLLLACNAGNMSLNSTGLGIGTSNPQAKLHVNGNTMIGSGSPAVGYLLSVNGKMIAEEVRVELDGSWPDYVFDKNYDLPSLQQLEKFIESKKHLPNIPSAGLVEQQGINLGDMNRRLLEKIEELTLYIIQQDKKLIGLEKKVNDIQAVSATQAQLK